MSLSTRTSTPGRISRALRAGAWWCSLLVSLAQAQPAATPLTSFQQVLGLPRAELAKKLPVHVQAVVTCADMEFGLIFLQDESAGIFLYRHTAPAKLVPGDFVDVTGVAASGRYAPIIDLAQIVPLGKKELPGARPVSIGELVLGSHFGGRVSVAGIVQRVEKRGTRLLLQLADGENSCPVWVHSVAGWERLDLLNARLRLKGVAASVIKKNQLTGFQFHVNDLSDLEVIEKSPGDAFATPASPISELWRYGEGRQREHRVPVAGIVTLQWSNRMTVVQDATGGVIIENGAPADLQVGNEVEAAGFLLQARFGPRLRNAEVRIRGAGRPVSAGPADLQNPVEYNHLLVQVTARVLDWQPQADGYMTAAMESSNVLFTAELPVARPGEVEASFPPGAVVRVTGVLRIARMDVPDSPRLSLGLRGTPDLLLLQPPPQAGWQRVVLPSLIAGLVVVAALALAGVYQRRAKAGLNRLEHKTQDQFAEMRRQLIQSQRDREVVVQELHDNIIQSIYSVGLGLDAARRGFEKNPQSARDRIGVAIEGLNALIRDLRLFIGGLEPKGIDGLELKTALKSLLLTVGPDEEARFSIQIDPFAARSLSSAQATEILNIAKEAMSNSMRHAQARKTSVSLQPHGGVIRLEVVDDGVGFTPGQAGETSMGLRNMRHRARNLGAKLDIVSAPGQGTRIITDIPTTTYEHD